MKFFCFLFLICSFIAFLHGLTSFRQPQVKNVVETITLNIAKTGGTGTIQITQSGIPYCTAKTEYDLIYTQAWATSHFRLWQMEWARRFITGTLSEILGKDALSLDIGQRKLQWQRVITENIKNAEPEILGLIDAYLDGANQYLRDIKTGNHGAVLPPEFDEYEVPFPKDFNRYDPFRVAKLVSQGLSGYAGTELGDQKIIEKIGPERFSNFFDYDSEDQPFLLPPYQHSSYGKQSKFSHKKNNNMNNENNLNNNNNNNVNNNKREIFKEKKILEKISESSKNPFGILFEQSKARFQGLSKDTSDFFAGLHLFNNLDASNDWVVGSKYSKSGLPLVCDDPHLPYLAPDVFFMIGIHLDSDEPTDKWQEIFGGAIIYTAGVGIGSNKWVSWGYTSSQVDTQDLFRMYNNNDNTKYFYNEQQFDYIIHQETIQVKGGDPVTETFYWCPSYNSPVTVIEDGIFYVMKWSAFEDTDTSLDAVVDLNHSKDPDSWRAANSKWNALAWNGVYGDIDGNIALCVTGKTPIRANGETGRIPTPGDGTLDWPGFIPWNDMPWSVNSEQGFYVTANNPPGLYPSQIKYPMLGYFAPGFRAQRIIDMILDKIDEKQLLDSQDMGDIQNDVTSLEYNYLFESISNLKISSGEPEKAITRYNDILGWNGAETTSSKLARTFERFTDCLSNVTVPETGKKAGSYNMKRIFNQAQPSGEGDDISCSFWDETCYSYAVNCFIDVAMNTTTTNYGVTHKSVFIHIPPTPAKWNAGPISQGGSPYTPFAASLEAPVGDGLLSIDAVVAGPGIRMIADQADKSNQWWISPPGNSANPNSPYYNNLLRMWADGEYVETCGWTTTN